MARQTRCDPEAIVYLIDNTFTSIDGDFEPNRLVAMIRAATYHANHMVNQNKDSKVACVTYGEGECGFRVSFTSDLRRFQNCADIIEPAGKSLLMHALQSSILALRTIPSPNDKVKKIIVFVSSPPDLSPADVTLIANAASEDKIILSFVILGEETPKTNILKGLLSKHSDSHFIVAPSSGGLLSDQVLASHLGPGATKAKISIQEYTRNTHVFVYGGNIKHYQDNGTEIRPSDLSRSKHTRQKKQKKPPDTKKL